MKLINAHSKKNYQRNMKTRESYLLKAEKNNESSNRYSLC